MNTAPHFPAYATQRRQLEQVILNFCIYLLTFPSFYAKITYMLINYHYNFTGLNRRAMHELCRTTDNAGTLQSNSKIELSVLIAHGSSGNAMMVRNDLGRR